MTTSEQTTPQNVVWFPQPGPQTEACLCPVDVILMGGTRGGGKSETLLGRQFYGAMTYGHLWNGLIFRRKYKDLKELRRRIAGLLRSGLPAELVGGEQQTNVLRFKNGGLVTITAMQYQEALNDWIGHAFTEIGIDEAPQLPFFATAIDKLRGSVRSAGGVQGHIFCTGNPGGPGHGQVKNFFKLGSGGNQPKTPFFVETEHNGIIYRESRVYIPSFLTDNKILCDADPQYVSRLSAISDPVLRKAWLDGDWDVFIGQAFEITERHIVPNQPVPEFAPIYMTYDWGFGKPFSIGWWWSDRENRLYRFNEWYGYSGKDDDGLRMVDSAVAEGILAKEAAMGITGRVSVRLCDPTSFNKRADTYGGGQGPSTADVFAEKGISLVPGDPNRKLKIRAFRERIALPKDGSPPMMMIYENCTHFLRTIPMLSIDEENPEEIDCFIAGTLISTDKGFCPIEKIKVGDLVKTPIGYMPVSKSGLAGKELTVTITLSNGKTLEATRDHKIYIKKTGLLPLCLISTGQEILTQEEQCQLLTNTKESSLQSVTIEDISNAIQHMQEYLERHCSTESFGLNPMGQSLKDLACIIKTTTELTTALKIWNSYLKVVMQDYIGKKELKMVAISPKLLSLGEKQKGEKKLFEATLKSLALMLPKENVRALIVANLLQQEISQESIVQGNAKIQKTKDKKHVKSAGNSFLQKNTTHEKSGLVVTHVVGHSEKKPVYYLTVEQSHLFYANQILTSNTDQEDHVFDEAALLAMFFTVPMYDIKPKKTPAEVDWEIIRGIRDSGTETPSAFIASD